MTDGDVARLDSGLVADRLTADWGPTVTSIAALVGGMNSRTWLVRTVGGRVVAKAVPAGRRRSLQAGLAVAAIVEARGIRSGAALPTRSGETVIEADGVALAVLRFVDGAPLDGESPEQRASIGSTLGQAHLALRGRDLDGAVPFPWLDPDASHLSVRPWIRPAIEGALATWRAIPPDRLTWAPLHTDPAPEAFRCSPGPGPCGLIDWDLGVIGPLV